MTASLRSILFASVLAASASGAVGATFEAQCAARLSPTTVSVKSDALSYRFDNTQSVGDLTRKSPPGNDAWVTLGLTTSRRLTSFQFNVETLTDPATGKICLRPQFTVAITQNPQLVSVARELRQGTCEYNVIATHELKHVEANHSHTTRVALVFKEELEKAFGNTIFYGEREALSRDLSRVLREAWQPRLQTMLAQVAQLHARIDSPEEYAHNSVVCEGVIPRILKAGGYVLQ